jgi:hypothetical protein
MARALLLAFLAFSPSIAAAQLGPGTYRHVRIAGGATVRLESVWAAQGPSRVTLRLGASEVVVHEGEPVVTTLSVRPDAALVAMVNGGQRPFAKVAVVPIRNGSLGTTVRLDAERPATQGFAPVAVIACPDPDGFTFIWQEQDSQGARDARTYLGRVNPSGQWIARPVVAQIPWAIAGLANNGHGYQLALFFDGQAPGETRLSMVSLNPQGVPEQHPDWASGPGLLQEVQLMSHGGRIVAYFRSGREGNELLSRDVTAIGGWGSDPQDVRSHGRLAADEEFALRAGANGVTAERFRAQ